MSSRPLSSLYLGVLKEAPQPSSGPLPTLVGIAGVFRSPLAEKENRHVTCLSSTDTHFSS